jgi:hypothetical protein
MAYSSGYFNVAHRNNRVAHDFAKLELYKTLFKHAALFNRRVIIADHMVVNAPNFRIAYHDDIEFRKLVSSELFSIANFEGDRSGNYWTLKELRQFYERFTTNGAGLFHPDLPPEFQSQLHDSELDQLQERGKGVPNCSMRDQHFTKFVQDGIDNDYLESELKRFYAPYRIAYEEMMKEVGSRQKGYPYIGIIHFDPKHTETSTKTIFDYMAEINFFRQRSIGKGEIIKLIGHTVATAHQAILLKAETRLIGVTPVLSSELKRHAGLVISPATLTLAAPNNEDVCEFPISLLDSGLRAMSSLTLDDIREYRKYGAEFFDVMDNLDKSNFSSMTIGSVVKNYVLSIDTRMAHRAGSERNRTERTTNYLVKVSKGAVSSAYSRNNVIAVAITIGAWFATSAYGVVVGAVAKAGMEPGGRALDSILEKHADNDNITGRGENIQAKIHNEKSATHLMQYE